MDLLVESQDATSRLHYLVKDLVVYYLLPMTQRQPKRMETWPTQLPLGTRKVWFSSVGHRLVLVNRILFRLTDSSCHRVFTFSHDVKTIRITAPDIVLALCDNQIIRLDLIQLKKLSSWVFPAEFTLVDFVVNQDYFYGQAETKLYDGDGIYDEDENSCFPTTVLFQTKINDLDHPPDKLELLHYHAANFTLVAAEQRGVSFYRPGGSAIYLLSVGQVQPQILFVIENDSWWSKDQILQAHSTGKGTWAVIQDNQHMNGLQLLIYRAGLEPEKIYPCLSSDHQVALGPHGQILIYHDRDLAYQLFY